MAVLKKSKAPAKVKGSHYLLDFFGCDSNELNSMAFWREHVVNASDVSGLEILKSDFHQFKPFGITGFLILSTSHISFHTWPENNYVACDVFSCGSESDTKKAVTYLKRHITHTRCEEKRVGRGYMVA